jgi:hypothetical protein
LKFDPSETLGPKHRVLGSPREGRTDDIPLLLTMFDHFVCFLSSWNDFYLNQQRIIYIEGVAVHLNRFHVSLLKCGIFILRKIFAICKTIILTP